MVRLDMPSEPPYTKPPKTKLAPPTNQEIATLIRHVSAVYVVQGVNIFQIKAYDNLANSIDQTSTSLYELWQDKQLDTIPGLGKQFQAYFDELFTIGKVAHFDNILQQVPAGFFPLVDLPGIGPKMAIKLATTLKLTKAETALEKVKTAAEKGKLNGLPGISTVMEKKILETVTLEAKDLPNRTLLITALETADTLKEYLLTSPAITKCEVLGSMRRRLPTVGDIDLAVCSEDPKAVVAHLEKYPHLSKLLATGEKTLAVRLSAGVRVDLKLSPESQWGSLLQHYTGSKLHNIKLRTIALEKDLSLSEFGIKHKGKLKTFEDEADFYHALGMDFIPPELRENTGEIEAAQKHTLPKLVELSDIKGDVHMHTNLTFPTSHDMGSSSIAELLAKAESLDYSFIGFSDHNPKKADLSPAQRLAAVKKRNQEIDEAVEEYFKGRKPTLKVLKGLEVDILGDGNLALEDEALSELDYVIASLHSDFNKDRDTTTKRILKALSHPAVKIMGHPTGRRLGKRNGVEADWETIATFCAENHKLLEINSSPERLDLPYDLVKSCQPTGVKFIVNTDSHQAASLDFMKFGVWMARKGWLTKKDVVNASDKGYEWLMEKL